jgi:hypothetical protein
MPNVLEYFLGTNPLAKDGKCFDYSKQVVDNASYLTITFKQAKDRSDAVAKAMTSVDLSHWQAEGIRQEVAAQDDKTQTIRIFIPMDAPQRWFQLILQTN